MSYSTSQGHCSSAPDNNSLFHYFVPKLTGMVWSKILLCLSLTALEVICPRHQNTLISICKPSVYFLSSKSRAHNILLFLSLSVFLPFSFCACLWCVHMVYAFHVCPRIISRCTCLCMCGSQNRMPGIPFYLSPLLFF